MLYVHGSCYATHCNTAQTCSLFTEYSPFIVIGYPAIYIVSSIGKKNGSALSKSNDLASTQNY